MLKVDFNRDWLFAKEASPAKTKCVTLPHDAMILEERSADAVTGTAGGFFPGGSYIYTKQFTVPKDAEGERWVLEFEGAYLDTSIYLNKCFVTSNHSGYRGFYADLTPYLKFGMENTLEVRVRNDAQVNSRWYTGSGLYRPVWLWRSTDVCIGMDALRIRTPEADEEVSRVVVEAAIENNLRTTTQIRMLTEIMDANGNTVTSENYPVTLFPGESPVISCQLFVKNAALWSTEDPNLYTCRVRLMKDEHLMDTVQEQFGIRHIQMDPVRGLRLNGKQVQLRGTCVHHDHGILGSADFADAAERKVVLCKKAGFNAMRIAHQSASKALLDACDKHGMLLMEESFDQWHHMKNAHDFSERFEQEWEQEVEAIVAKDFNHPSVFMYCIGNEIQELGELDGIRMSRKLTNKFRQLDSSRFVTNAINGGMILGDQMFRVLVDIGVFTPEQLMGIAQSKKKLEDGEEAKSDINDLMTILSKYMPKIISHRFIAEKMEEICSHLDICGYNYMLDRYVPDMQAYPNRILFGSETNPPKIDKLWACTEEYPACIGDFTWTGLDYLGETGIGITSYNAPKSFAEPYPVYTAYCGDMDITGYRLPISYFRETVFGLRKAPYVTVQNPAHYEDKAFNTPWAIPETVESWTWPGFENKKVNVTVFAASDEVALFRNGEAVAKVACGKKNGYKATVDMEYIPGELLAVGYTDGKEDGRFRLETVQQDWKLQVTLSQKELSADGSDLVYLDILVTDQNGIVHTEEETRVSVSVTGNAALVGFGSGDPKSTENFYDSIRTTHRGHVLAAIRGTEIGIARVEVAAEACETVILEFPVK